MRDLQPAELANNRSLRRSLGNLVTTAAISIILIITARCLPKKNRKPRNLIQMDLCLSLCIPGSGQNLTVRFDRRGSGKGQP